VAAALGPQHPSSGYAVDLVAKLRGSLQLRVPDWLLNDSIWRR
jgi:NADH:ubiquinone oxidoreductase subunit D